MVTVAFKVPGAKGPAFAPFTFDPEEEDGGNEPYRVRHLIAKLVSESVRDFHLREKAGIFQVLTPAAIERGLTTGKFGKAREEAQSVDLDEAVGQALQAFEDGLFLLFVDEDQKHSLEDLVALNPNTNISVIRLTALAGR